MRIVSLACSNTEIVVALGRADWLVGVDDHSDHPPEVVDALPTVGPDLEIDMERVAELEPDLVLATLTVPGHEEVVSAVEEAGLRFIAPAPESLEDVYRDVLEIGRRLNAADRAREVVAGMRRELGPGGGRDRETPTRGPGPPVAPDPAARPSFLVQWWPKPTIAPGRRSWTTDVIRAAGGRNVLAHETVKSRPVADDEVVELDPDAIVVSWCGVDPAKYRPEVVREKEAWQGLEAVRRGRVYCVPEAYLGRPGPRLVEGVRALRAIVEELGAPEGG